MSVVALRKDPERPASEITRSVPSRRGSVIFLVAVTIALAAAAVAHVWVRLRVIKLGYELSQGSVEEQKLAELNRRLRIEAAVLRQAGRIELIARERLGMARPETERIHVLHVNAGSALAAPAVETERTGAGTEVARAAQSAARIGRP